MKIHPGFPQIILTLVFVFAAALWLPQSVAQADIAPPEQPPGANPGPESKSTQVRMMAETVTIDIRAGSNPGDLGSAKTSATFTMRNLGSADEQMQVRFPLSFATWETNPAGHYPEINEISVQIDGRTIPTRRITTPSANGGTDHPDPWAVFDATFPTSKDVTIQVSYIVGGWGEQSYVAYRYIVETGAGWNGTIGSADFIVRLPYEVNNQNVLLGESASGFGAMTPGSSMSGNELRWHYDNLEPTAENNLLILVVTPQAWKKVLAENQNVTTNPQDGEAWGRLGKAYKEIIVLRRGLREDEGGRAIYPLSVTAYEKALVLLPKDALWHYGFADLLWLHFYYEVYWRNVNKPDYTELVRTIGELQKSLDYSPGNQKALDLLQEISYAVPGVLKVEGDRIQYLLLTATPTPEPEATPVSPEPSQTPTVPPTPTLPPTHTPTALLTPAPQITPSLAPEVTATIAPRKLPLPVCGAGLVVPLAAVACLGWIKKKRTIS